MRVGETGVGEMGVGEKGQIIGETGVGEMGVGEMGVIRNIEEAGPPSPDTHTPRLYRVTVN